MEDALSKCKFENTVSKDFYVSAETLAEEEKKLSAGDEVLVMSPELSMDIEDRFYSTIKENISKGVKYHYVLPEGVHSVTGQVNNLKKKLLADIPGITTDYLSNALNIEYLPDGYIVGGITLHVKQAKGFVNVPHREYEKSFFLPMDEYFFGRTESCITKMVKDYREKKK